MSVSVKNAQIWCFSNLFGLKMNFFQPNLPIYMLTAHMIPSHLYMVFQTFYLFSLAILFLTGWQNCITLVRIKRGP